MMYIPNRPSSEGVRRHRNQCPPWPECAKTDGKDAHASYQASRRKSLRAVPVKTVVQQDELLPHRLRERRKKARVALMNQVRGFLAERGSVCGRGTAALRQLVQNVLARSAAGEVTSFFCDQLAGLWREWQELDDQIAAAERVISAHFQTTAACQQIAEVEGIGPITASAVLAQVGEPAVSTVVVIRPPGLV